ncbi:MAG: AlkZ family DNA glycosylase [Nitrososphaerota archaeon]|nr:AlkZ family DNA glycosylase [Nitrososphaerota archaeon]
MTGRGPSGEGVTRVSWDQVAAFRLSRHHLGGRASRNSMTVIPGKMGGAQAQILLAGQMSVGARVSGVTLSDLERALWNDRTLVKAWCMRRTMFLLPSSELALFVRGSALRAEREMRWVLSKGVPVRELERLVEEVLDALNTPITQTALAQEVGESLGLRVTYGRGGGWGSRRRIPHVRVGPLALPSTYLLHLAGARGVYCSGPNAGTESTFVRADRWVPHWKDVEQKEAERDLVIRYLRAFGPANTSDFATWTGMTARDAQGAWSSAEGEMAEVDVEGESGVVLWEDLSELSSASLDGPIVKLLPFFDSFLLGHRSHKNIVGPSDHRHVYRQAGWVSPVLLVNGRAAGVWSHVRKGRGLEIAIRPFARLPNRIASMAYEEAGELGRFLGCTNVATELLMPTV